MINGEKIRRMTKLAIYESNDGKEAIKINGYYRSDYIGRNMLKTALKVTVSYIAIFAVWATYNFDPLMTEIYSGNLLPLGKKVLLGYISLLVLFEVSTYIEYSIRYYKGSNSIREYDKELKKMEYLYNKESKHLDKRSDAGGKKE